MDSTTISVAFEPDVPEATALINRAFAVEQFFKPGDRITPEGVRDLMTKGTFLLARAAAGRLVGCVYVQLRGDHGYMGLLSVDPDAQGRGYGAFLTKAAEEHCRAAGCSAIDIRVVNLRTELPPFYLKQGYRQTGTEDFDGEATQPCHFMLMSKPLR